MTASIKVEGLKKLGKELKEIDKSFAKELNKLSKAAAATVSVEATGLAPVRSGALSRHVKPGATASGGFVKVSGLPYVGPIIGGWPQHNIKRNPFIFNALDNKHDEVIQQFTTGVAELIDRSITAGTGE